MDPRWRRECKLGTSSLVWHWSFSFVRPRLKPIRASNKARSIAMKARHGTITDEELEKEKGGSGLRYSFDIKNNNVIYEVGLDAETGKVFENAREGRHPD